MNALPTILIVENHRDFREAVHHFLKVSELKANLREASSGEEAIALAKKTKPEVALVDFRLKGVSGLETAERIKADAPDCSIIILTMFDTRDVGPLGRRGLVKSVIHKNELYDKLIPAIRKAIHV